MSGAGQYLRRARAFLVHHVLHPDDPPHAIALGAAIGTFVAFLPIMGVQTAVSVALASLLRANRAICVPIVAITNPFTAMPIYGACLRLGHRLTSSAEIQSHPETPLRLEWSLLDPDSLTRIFHLGVDMWVGCVVVATVLAAATYGAALWGVTWHRRRRSRTGGGSPHGTDGSLPE